MRSPGGDMSMRPRRPPAWTMRYRLPRVHFTRWHFEVTDRLCVGAVTTQGSAWCPQMYRVRTHREFFRSREAGTTRLPCARMGAFDRGGGMQGTVPSGAIVRPVQIAAGGDRTVIRHADGTVSKLSFLSQVSPIPAFTDIVDIDTGDSTSYRWIVALKKDGTVLFDVPTQGPRSFRRIRRRDSRQSAMSVLGF